MIRLTNIVLMALGTLATTTAFTGAFAADGATGEATTLNLRKGVTDISGQVYDLHMLMFTICVVIAVVVFGAMFISIYLHTHATS